MAKKSEKSDKMEEDAEKKSDPLHEIREKFKYASEYWSDDRLAALDDIKFRAGEQWPDEVIVQRERDKRPALVLDKLSQYVRQIVNDGRQNRPSIKVLPVDAGADVATANVISGIIKHIETSSNADAAYDTALDSAATCGQGYFRVLTEYVGDDSFDQEIVIRRIRNPMSVLIDPECNEADCSDMKFAFVVEEMSDDTFEETYPDKTPQSWEMDDSQADWFGETVRIAEYWYVEEEDRDLHLLQDGTVISDEKLKELEKSGVELMSLVKETRNIPKRKVMHCKMTGTEYLEEPTEWPGRYIPILVVWGNETDIEGKVTHSGIIRPGKDPQRLYNYARTAFAERVALAPKAPWVAAEGQIDDFADEWATANVENHSVLRYRPTSLNGTPVPPPMRQTAADVPAGFAQDMQLSEHDIQAAIGMYAASLGAPSNERSGKAIMARQREGDVGTFHYHDNLNRAIRHCGRILVDLIPHIYDSNRVVRILGYDGTPGEATLNPVQPTASQQMGVQMMYNLGVGRYDVSITSGPSYNTLRQESSAAMIEMVQANPALMQIAGDIIVKNQDWPGAAELSERLKLTLPPEIQQAEQSKNAQQMPPEMQQAMNQMQMAMQQKDQQLQQAMQALQQMQGEMQKLKTDVEAKEKEVIIKAADTEIKAYQAETQRMQALQQAMTPEQIQAIVMQTLQDLMTPNTVDLNRGESETPSEMAEYAQSNQQMANMPPQGMANMEQPLQ